MMQQAAHDATLYCAEARRTVILPRDIELALKRLVLPGSTGVLAYWSRDNLPEEAQQIRHRLFVDASSEESDSGDSWVKLRALYRLHATMLDLDLAWDRYHHLDH
jgi:hypothetical protein